MTVASASDVYYDTYDVDVFADGTAKVAFQDPPEEFVNNTSKLERLEDEPRP